MKYSFIRAVLESDFKTMRMKTLKNYYLSFYVGSLSSIV